MKYPQKRRLRPKYEKQPKSHCSSISSFSGYSVNHFRFRICVRHESSTAISNTTTSGTNGYYPNGMTGNQWSGMMGNMMGGNWGSSSSTPTPVAATAQNSILPLIGFITLIGAALTGTGGAVYYFAGRPKISISPNPATQLKLQ